MVHTYHQKKYRKEGTAGYSKDSLSMMKSLMLEEPNTLLPLCVCFLCHLAGFKLQVNLFLDRYGVGCLENRSFVGWDRGDREASLRGAESQSSGGKDHLRDKERHETG